jgi:hypothetical protein
MDENKELLLYHLYYQQSASHKLQYNFISITYFILLIKLNITCTHNITFVVFENYDEYTTSQTTYLLKNGRFRSMQYHSTKEKEKDATNTR